MKLKSLALFVGACCGLAMPAVSNAAESFGFHGYIRAGSMFDAKDNFAKQHPDKQYKISMMSTPPVLYLKLDGYMLEGFAAVISGGVIEPVE